MKIQELLKGKKVNVMTDAKVEVQLEIESITFDSHSRDLEPATPQNDWYPPQQTWQTVNVKFTNGFIKTYQNISEINFI